MELQSGTGIGQILQCSYYVYSAARDACQWIPSIFGAYLGIETCETALNHWILLLFGGGGHRKGLERRMDKKYKV